MENNKKKVSIFVAGQRFNILTEKPEKYVLNIASEIDARIASLVMSGNMTRERAAVLTALDFADDNSAYKEDLAAVKDQIKDYLQQVERLGDDNAKLSSDYHNLKAEYERLIAERKSAEDAQKELIKLQAQMTELHEENERLSKVEQELKETKDALAESQAKVTALEIDKQKLIDMFEAFKHETPAAPVAEKTEVPAPVEKSAPPEVNTITAEDDLFFDAEEAAPVKPQKDKKKRHNHDHVNPYQQKAQQKKEQKGYTQQRQYSFFDVNEDE